MNYIYSFLRPIVDSGFLFTNNIESVNYDSSVLSIQYGLTNRYNGKIKIPITISEQVVLNCSHENDLKDDNCISKYGQFVIDMQNNNKMYGYGDDHHVSFNSNETKHFNIIFGEIDNIDTIDYINFMKPYDLEYGIYRIRYSLRERSLMKIYCEKIIEGYEFYEPDETIFK